MNALIKHEPTVPDLVMALMPKSIEEAMRLAQFMARSKMVPRHLQDDPGTCLMIIEQATRWRMSPFAVAQCTSNIGGKLMYEGKLTAAAVESIGAIEGHFDYDYQGEGDHLAVTVSARRTGESNPRRLTVKLRDVRTTNEWWRKQPEQQLAYSATRAWARRYTPSAMLGVYAPEEFDKGTRFEGTTIEGDIEPEPKAAPAPKPEAAAPQDARDAINQEVPLADYPGRPDYRLVTAKGTQTFHTGSEWMEAWRRIIEACQRQGAYDKLRQARTVNELALTEVHAFDPQAAEEILELLGQIAPTPEDRLEA